MRTSIQKRLFGILGLFVLANAILWSGLALLLAYVVEDEVIERVLSSQARELVEAHSRGENLPSPALPELRLYDSATEVPPELRAQIDENSTRGEIFTEDQSHYHFRRINLPGRAPVLLVAEVSTWLVVTHISLALLILMLTGLALATALGLVTVALIARITTRPLRELTAAIQTDPRPSPLPHVKNRDEVGVLASSMGTALEQLQEALARERAFTRDVSHELRTPMTTLKNALQLMTGDAHDNPQMRQLEASSRELEHTLTSLLALARAESTEQESLPLRAILEKLLMERNEVLETGGFEVSIDVPDDGQVRGNSQVTRLLLGNLLDNALHYADPPLLTIRWRDSGLCLENPQRASGSQPHVNSMRHGLALAERLAAAQSWRLETDARGDVFRATLNWA